MQFLCDSDLSDKEYKANRTLTIRLKEEVLIDDKESYKIHTINARFPDMEEEYIPVRRAAYIELIEVALGYAITVHKAQGSSWKNIILYNQAFGDNELDRLRWMYTGVTRIEEKLVWVF